MAPATALAASPPHSPRNPDPDQQWTQLGTDTADTEFSGAAIYIDANHVYRVGDGSPDDGNPVSVDVWIILKNEADGPQGRFTELEVRDFYICDTHKIMKSDVTYYSADGANLGHEGRAGSEAEGILLGSIGEAVYNLACKKGVAR